MVRTKNAARGSILIENVRSGIVDAMEKVNGSAAVRPRIPKAIPEQAAVIEYMLEEKA